MGRGWSIVRRIMGYVSLSFGFHSIERYRGSNIMCSPVPVFDNERVSGARVDIRRGYCVCVLDLPGVERSPLIRWEK